MATYTGVQFFRGHGVVHLNMIPTSQLQHLTSVDRIKKNVLHTKR